MIRTSTETRKKLGDAFSELRTSFNARDPLPEFMDLADDVQEALYETLNRSYRHETFSKILAIKVTNLAVARRLYATKEVGVISRPMQLMLDPANNCQLHCPGCVHTSTENRGRFDWPSGLMAPDMFSRYLDSLGPFAFCAVFYNYGEPLLNVHTPDYIRAAKAYLLSTMTSTNLMLVRDPDDLVDSGLDYLVASIDGVSQQAYDQYRRGGDVAECFANMRRIVEAKRKRNSPTPYIVWQYLTFEHNVHEVEQAVTLAREIGINELLVATPFEVTFDDPSIHGVTSDKRGQYIINGGPTRQHSIARVPSRSQVVEDHFRQSWKARLSTVADVEAPPTTSDWTCGWLYQGMTVDAVGRVMPCCGAPSVGIRNYVYGSLQDEGDWFNSERYTLSRLAYRNRQSYEESVKNPGKAPTAPGAGTQSVGSRVRLPMFDEGRAPYCASCQRVPAPAYQTSQGVPLDVASMDPEGVLPGSDIEFWSQWP
jgi:pyruvate-formate lyase-activating enzyme